ncbi:MAG: glycosyltransferase family 4 protein, partial [archaeon GB-1867-035]|nr:glycosyltransferase family 4 protein [Candidatus Culexmicrobium profundum]
FIGGLDEDISRVKSYCEAIGVDRVIFTGFIKPRNVPIYLKLADILVHYTPRGRGFSPLKIFEYMCARKPIVAPNSPGVNEVLRDGVNALLYNPESPEDMAYKIKLILDDSELGFKLAEQAYLDAINKYTFKARAERILKVLNVYGG